MSHAKLGDEVWFSYEACLTRKDDHLHECIDDIFVPSTVVSCKDGDEEIVVKTSGGGQVHRILAATAVTIPDTKSKEGVADILQLDHFSEESLLHNLRVRYFRNEVYTFVGPILISINPYAWNEGLHTTEVVMKYHHSDLEGLAPHLFSVAEYAYSSLVDSNGRVPRNQSIIISGESGAGKTEATKIIMQYLARVTASKPAPNGRTSHGLGELEQRVLSANPLLESFGNAKTLRNDNSSRFGKFIEIQFDNTGRITGAKVDNYLLEKTRIVHQTEGERNYHIFYQLLAGAGMLEDEGGGGRAGHGIFAWDDDEGEEEGEGEEVEVDEEAEAALCAELQLRPIQEFNYLNQSDSYCIRGRDERWELKQTKECMAAIGLCDEQQANIFKILAAILHLGNVEFCPSTPDATYGHLGVEGGTVVCPGDASLSLERASSLAGFEATQLAVALCSKQMTVNNAPITKTQTPAQATAKRDALAKALFHSVFIWLIACLNKTISLPKRRWGFIGVLDIYGFEVFDNNSLEQLCINFANEKLQRHFNLHMLEAEQKEYRREGIDWTRISFRDNQQCLDLIEGKPGGMPGVLAALGDVWRLEGEGADNTFVSRMHTSFAPVDPQTGSGKRPKKKGGKKKEEGKAEGEGEDAASMTESGEWVGGEGVHHPYYVRPRMGHRQLFGIRHFAGEVLYEAKGFNAKNHDALTDDLRALLQTCPRNPWLVKIFNSSVAAETAAAMGSASAPSSSGAVKSRSRSRHSSASGALLRERSVTMQFKDQLQQLLASIGATEPRYIRCVKPNEEKAALCLRAEEVLRQLKYAGMMESVRIRSSGYALRELHASFLDRFKPLAPSARSAQELVEQLTTALGVGPDQWQMGLTKVFVKWQLHRRMEGLVRCRMNAAARTIQRGWHKLALRRRVARLQAGVRRFVAATRYRRLRSSAVLVQSHMRVKLARLLCHRLRRERVARAEAALRLQCAVRCRLARLAVAKIRAEHSCVACNLKVARGTKFCPHCGHRMDMSLEDVAAAEAAAKADAEAEAEAKEEAARQKLLAEQRQKEEEEEREREEEERKRKEEERKRQEEERKRKEEERKRQEEEERVRAEKEKKRKAEEEEAERVAAEVAAEAERKRQEEAAELEREREREAREQEKLAREGGENGLRARLPLTSQKMFDRADVLQKQLEEEEEKGAGDDAVAAAASASLRTQLQALAARQLLLPTAPETVRLLLPSARACLAAAAARQDYSLCASLQPQIEELDTALKESPVGAAFTGADALQQQLAAAAKRQDYAVCAELQQALERGKTAPLYGPAPDAGASASASASPWTVACFPEEEDIISGAAAPAAAPAAATASAATASTAATAAAVKAPVVVAKAAPTAAAAATPRVVAVAPQTGSSAFASTKTVSQLRPAKAMMFEEGCSVRDAAKRMSGRRADAALVVGKDQSLRGIITDTDVTRRVISKGLDPDTTTVGSVMTRNPQCVQKQDSALEALCTMMDNHFRHLPVLDDVGRVVGLLDIARCLYDAISQLEKMQQKTEGEQADRIAKIREQLATMGVVGSAADPMVAQLKSSLQDDRFSAKLHDVLKLQTQSPQVSPEATILDAAGVMTACRQAVSVVEAGRVVGIFTPKDMLMRVVARGVDVGAAITEVMTPNPDCVPDTSTVLDSLHTMHERRYLHLPVVDGREMSAGLVDVLLLMEGASGDGASGGWREFWESSFLLQDDTGSVVSEDDRHSTLSGFSAPVSHSQQSSRRPSVMESVKPEAAAPAAPSISSTRKVSQLRPQKPMLFEEELTVTELAKRLAGRRADAALVVGKDQSLRGIITDTDVTRRVISKGLDPDTTTVGSVMTRNPQCVQKQDSALEALCTMMDNHFRHLPVLDDVGRVVGLLDIARCLYDAISQLEKMQQKTEGEQADRIAKIREQLATMGVVGSAADPMVAQLKSSLQDDRFSAKLHDVLKLQTQSPQVSPEATILDAAGVMTACRQAVSVVEAGRVVGIFTPKDMLMRVVARGVDVGAAITEVMTPNPDCVPDTSTVLDSLHTMHERRFLHLPVVEGSGAAVGLVDVLLLMQGASNDGASGGWREFWESSFLLQDDTSSVVSDDDRHSTISGFSAVEKQSQFSRPPSELIRERVNTPPAPAAVTIRQVSQLRPQKPLLLDENMSITEVAQRLAGRRGDAALVAGKDKSLRGIITDTDVTRRVISKGLDPDTTTVGSVMTRNPQCVQKQDSALEALCTMMDNHFRHLPVLDDVGRVVGLLDIARCLYDAISQLEKMQQKTEGEQADRIAKIREQLATMGVVGSAADPMVAQLKSSLQDDRFSAKLHDVLKLQTQSPQVSPEATILDAAGVMTACRQAVSVVEAGRVVGIFTPKDMLMRVVARGVDVGAAITEVMTPNPDCVPDTSTVLDSLHTMHERRYLHLPVVDGRDMSAGLVDVLLLMEGASGDGTSDWREFWESSFLLQDDTGSVVSEDDRHSVSTFTSAAPSVYMRRGSFSESGPVTLSASALSARDAQERREKEKANARAHAPPKRTVGQLRPATAVMVCEDISVVEAAEKMGEARLDAALVVGKDKSLRGIITDTDVTRRVISKGLDPDTTTVGSVMTRNPQCVQKQDSALEALCTMMDNHFRHLPVVDDVGQVVGLLDIGRCLYDAIRKLEASRQSGSGPAHGSREEDLKKLTDQVKAMGQGVGEVEERLLSQLLGPLKEKLLMPSLGSVLEGAGPCPQVRPNCSIRDAADLMSSRRSAVLVVEAGLPVGVFSPKEMLLRVVQQGQDPATTVVGSVMSPDPDCVEASTSILEALHTMHTCGYMHLPVVDEEGAAFGVVDILTLIGGAGGDDWRDFWTSSFLLGDEAADESASVAYSATPMRTMRRGPRIVTSGRKEAGGRDSMENDTIGDLPSFPRGGGGDWETGSSFTSISARVGSFLFKVRDPTGRLHRIRSSETSLAELRSQVQDKLKTREEVWLTYTDDDGEEVTASCDDDLADAVAQAQKKGEDRVMICASLSPDVGEGTPFKRGGKLPPVPPSPSASATSAAPSAPSAVQAFTPPRKSTAVVAVDAPRVVAPAPDEAVPAKSSSGLLLVGLGVVAAAAAAGVFVVTRSKR